MQFPERVILAFYLQRINALNKHAAHGECGTLHTVFVAFLLHWKSCKTRRNGRGEVPLH